MSFINIDRVIEKLRNPNNNLLERKEAAKLLGQTGADAAVDALIDFLPDPNMRLDVVISLGRLANPKALKFLLTTLFDSDSSVKLEIIRAFRRIGNAKVVGPLIQFFKQEEDENVCAATFILLTQYGTLEEIYGIIPVSLKSPHVSLQTLALKYLYEQGDARVASLLYPLLFSEDEKVKALAGESLWKFEGQDLLKKLNYVLIKTADLRKRMDVAFVYGELGMIQEVAPLVYVLLNDESEPLRCEVLRALRKIGDLRVIKPIVKVLFNSPPTVMCAALDALASFKRPEIPKIVARFLQHADDTVREAAKSAFERVVTPMDIQTIKQFFQSDDARNLEFVARILGELDLIDDEITNFLASCLDHENSDVAVTAIYTLGKLKLDQLNGKLIILLDNESEDVRTAVVKALGKIGEEGALEPIATLYKKESSNKVRATIINVMGDFGVKSYMSTVKLALKDEDPRVRSNAIEAMEAMGGEEIIDYIFPLTEDSNNRVKANAAKTLWKFGGVRMIAILEKMLLKEKDKWQRASAAFALGEIGNLQIIKLLLMALVDEEDCVRANVVKALGKTLSLEVVPNVIPTLQDPSERVQEEAVQALGKLGSIEVLEPLVNYLRDHNEYQVMETICTALESAVDHNYLLPLTHLVQEESGLIRILSARLLGRIGEDSTIPVLKELLNDGNVNIRTTAEVAIRKIAERVRHDQEEKAAAKAEAAAAAEGTKTDEEK